MSRWDDLFNQHQIHTTLSELYDWASKNFDQQNPDVITEKRRALKVIDLLKNTLKYLDPEVVPFHLLDEINNRLRDQNIWGQLSTYKDNGSVDSIRTANDSINHIFGQLSQLVLLSKKYALDKNIKSTEVSFDGFIDTISKQEKNISQKISDLSGKLEQETKKQSELSQAIETKRQQVEGQLSEWLNQFSSAQNQRSTDYNEWRKQIENDIKKDIQDIVAKSKGTLDEEQKNLINLLRII